MLWGATHEHLVKISVGTLLLLLCYATPNTFVFWHRFCKHLNPIVVWVSLFTLETSSFTFVHAVFVQYSYKPQLHYLTTWNPVDTSGPSLKHQALLWLVSSSILFQINYASVWQCRFEAKTNSSLVLWLQVQTTGSVQWWRIHKGKGLLFPWNMWFFLHPWS